MSIFDLFRPKVHLPRVAQETDSHCGPAVLQQLLAYLNLSYTQEEIVRAAGNHRRIAENGTQPKQLAKAVSKLAPDLQYWFKQKATIQDLDTLINQYRWPVGINWQGLFYDTEEEQRLKSPKGDLGHYSVIIDVNPAKDKVTIADPYPDYAGKRRVFSLQWFIKRWWDVAHELNKKTGLKTSIKTKRFIFIITPKDAKFPQQLGMKLPKELTELIYIPKVRVLKNKKSKRK